MFNSNLVIGIEIIVCVVCICNIIINGPDAIRNIKMKIRRIV